jgi:hypothetical protein
MIIKLSKNVLYAGIGITILFRLLKFVLLYVLKESVTNKIIDISQFYLFSSLFDTGVFAFDLILLNEILRQIKQNHSFSVLFILLFIAQFFNIFATSIQMRGFDFFFTWIPILLYWPIAITIAIKYFQLKGRLSDLFKIFGAFELLVILAGIFINIAYRFVGVSESVQIQWVFMSLSFITTFLLCYIFFESSKCLDDNMEMSDNDILDNI